MTSPDNSAQENATQETPVQENHRQHFRLELGSHVLGTMWISRIGNAPVDTAKSRVCIIDLSAGGIKFRTSLDFPIKKNVFFSVEMDLLDEHFCMVGNLVRRVENEDGSYDYGLKSIATEDEKTPWVRVLNNLIVMQKKTPWKIKYVACDC